MQCGWTHPLLYLGLHAKVQKSQFSSFNVCVSGCRERTTLCVQLNANRVYVFRLGYLLLFSGMLCCRWLGLVCCLRFRFGVSVLKSVAEQHEFRA
jgi:hypothetical protein